MSLLRCQSNLVAMKLDKRLLLVNQQMLRVMLNVIPKYFQLGWQNYQLGWPSRKTYETDQTDQKQADVKFKNVI